MFASLPTIKEEPNASTAQAQAVQPPPTTTKKEPVEEIVLARPRKLQPEIIILDDTPPRVCKRAAADILKPSASTIKAEPVDNDRALPAISSSIQTTFEGGALKKAKLEANYSVPAIDDDVELVKLKEEEERLEEELFAAQRVADLIRKRNESKARIAALEARSSSTPGMTSRN